MSNWRISFGVGPLRYIRQLGRRQQGKPKQKKSALGAVVTLLVVGVAVYLCCWGGVAFLSRDL
ncbi:hypothetical protein [Micromonospora sp. URMC 103]|uniref:hypothetical protein n=1 Tax=Micromonospora sp. URMC 103 TaxID=3423406 RepID=UPI003F1DD86F